MISRRSLIANVVGAALTAAPVMAIASIPPGGSGSARQAPAKDRGLAAKAMTLKEAQASIEARFKFVAIGAIPVGRESEWLTFGYIAPAGIANAEERLAQAAYFALVAIAEKSTLDTLVWATQPKLEYLPRGDLRVSCRFRMV